MSPTSLTLKVALYLRLECFVIVPNGRFSLEPAAWADFGFWERFYDRVPDAVEVYEREKNRLDV